MSDDQHGSLSLIAFSWLLQLRWGAVVCQILLIVAVYFLFGMEIPLILVLVILSFELISNIGFQTLRDRQQHISSRLFGLVMFFDLVLLTALLYYTGGAMNPFTFLFLVHITIGAMLMRPLWTWALTVFSMACYGLLFYLPDYSSDLTMIGASGNKPVCIDQVMLNQQQSHLLLHLQGMWVAYAITAMFIVFFVARIQRSLEERQQTISRLREEKLRNEKLASLATLAAGAAHEFSTPLATIAVAAGEMLYNAESRHLDAEIIEDAKLIRQQVERCREILYQLSADAGEHLGEPHVAVLVADFMKKIIESLQEEYGHAISLRNDAGDLVIKVPYRSLFRSLRGIIKNSIDSTPASQPIEVLTFRQDTFICFEIIDHGEGMDAETLAQAAEPFFSTKETGKGMGLGLFLARSLAERYGGDLHIQSEQHRGTTVRLRLSLSEVK